MSTNKSEMQISLAFSKEAKKLKNIERFSRIEFPSKIIKNRKFFNDNIKSSTTNREYLLIIFSSAGLKTPDG